MFQGDGNHYASNSGNSYTYTYVTNNFDHSFNQTHRNSHNGHGRGGMCGVLVVVLGLGIPVAILWVVWSVLVEVLR